ncbi:helix-turn-helix domain-containing protein [Lactobacillus jensenii]
MSDFNLARLKAERIARGYSQQKFARALGVSYVTIYIHLTRLNSNI